MADSNEIPFSKELQKLENCGIVLVSSVERGEVLESLQGTHYICGTDAYWELLCTLGETDGYGTSGFPSDCIWHFDAECINNHGDYAAIVKRLFTLAGANDALDALEDYVDLEKSEAWLSFNVNEQSYKWHAQVNDDWVDSEIVTKIAALLESQNPEYRFT